MKLGSFLTQCVGGLLLVVAVAGCGGGGAGAMTPEPDQSAGPMRVQGNLNLPVVDVLTGGLTVYGFSGAITKAYWTDATPTLEETELVFARSSLRTGEVILACEPDGSNERTIVSLSAIPKQVRVSPDGAWLYYVEGTTLKRIPMGGGAPTQVLTDVNSFALTPSGTRAVVHRPTSNVISVVNVNGTGVEVRLDSTVTNDAGIVGCLSEEAAVFINYRWATNPSVGTLQLTGPSQTYNYFFTGSNSSVRDVALDARRDMVYVYCESSDLKTRVWEYAFILHAMLIREVRDDLPQTPFPVSSSFAPDNLRMVAIRTTNPPSLVTLDRDFNVTGTIVQDVFMRYVTDWAPAPTFRTFVGAGNYASGAAAVLFTDKGGRTPAVVLADCSTRASMTLTRVSETSDATLIYRLECDNLTKLHYTKSNSFTQVSVVGSITGLKGAFISFNGETGRVSNVVTYTKRPTISRSGRQWAVEGEGIAEVYDGEGAKKPDTQKLLIR
ncbi:MAG: hypothetical protein IT363_10580 [Methanoregulaceae archaeon]|nr:hypothetical protein [Methanoregulaceae archaeon]